MAGDNVLLNMQAEMQRLRLELNELRNAQGRGGTEWEPEEGPNDVEWKLVASTFVFFMQLGFAMVESGMCRQVNGG